MAWYAQDSSTVGNPVLKQAAASPGSGWTQLTWADDSMSQAQVTQTIQQSAPNLTDSSGATLTSSSGGGGIWGIIGNLFTGGPIGGLIAGGADAFSAVSGTASALAGVGRFFEDVWKQLTNWRMWASLGWLFLGLLLMLAGIGLWMGPSSGGISPVALAQAGLKAAFL